MDARPAQIERGEGSSRIRSPHGVCYFNGLVIDEILNWVVRTIGAPPVSTTPAVATQVAA